MAGVCDLVSAREEERNTSLQSFWADTTHNTPHFNIISKPKDDGTEHVLTSCSLNLARHMSRCLQIMECLEPVLEDALYFYLYHVVMWVGVNIPNFFKSYEIELKSLFCKKLNVNRKDVNDLFTDYMEYYRNQCMILPRNSFSCSDIFNESFEKYKKFVIHFNNATVTDNKNNKNNENNSDIHPILDYFYIWNGMYTLLNRQEPTTCNKLLEYRICDVNNLDSIKNDPRLNINFSYDYDDDDDDGISRNDTGICCFISYAIFHVFKLNFKKEMYFPQLSKFYKFLYNFSIYVAYYAFDPNSEKANELFYLKEYCKLKDSMNSNVFSLKNDADAVGDILEPNLHNLCYFENALDGTLLHTAVRHNYFHYCYVLIKDNFDYKNRNGQILSHNMTPEATAKDVDHLEITQIFKEINSGEQVKSALDRLNFDQIRRKSRARKNKNRNQNSCLTKEQRNAMRERKKKK